MKEIRISCEAYMKMQALVSGYDTEVQWYGVVDRINKDTFRITDILVCPQCVTAVSCGADDNKEILKEFESWRNNLDTEVFFNLRFNGHSHVKMPVTPSQGDREYYQEWCQSVIGSQRNKFYLFLIINKYLEMYWVLFDAEGDEPKFYFNDDLVISFEVNEITTVDEYFEESKKMVRNKKKPLITSYLPSKVTNRKIKLTQNK